MTRDERAQLSSIGRYQLLMLLATGGMAEIYLARQTGIGGFEKLVVLKRILPSLVQQKQFVEMFLDEAIIAARLNHPNIVQIYDLGQVDGEYFIAMEFLEGESLGALANQGVQAGRPVSWPLAAAMVAQVCDGLHYAHTFEDEQGRRLDIVHRDISPHNIIVLFNGMVKLVDFGIAKAATKMHQTRVGTLKGKLAYMSPEQCTGQEVDARSDIFSLGIVLWELLARRRLFRHDSEAAIIRAIADEPIPALAEARAEVPAQLVAVVDRALQKDPAQRYQSAAEMAAALRAYLQQQQEPAGPEAIAAYIMEVFGDKARTKKKLLEQIARRGNQGDISPRALKPASDSFPSSSRAGPSPAAGHGDYGETIIKPESGSAIAPPRRRWPLAIALLLVLGAAAWGAWHLWGQAPEDEAATVKTSPPPATAGNTSASTTTTPATSADAGRPAPGPAGPPAPAAVVASPARLTVRSQPAGCAVEIDGRRLEGVTPLEEVAVEPGQEHRVAVLCRGRQRQVKKVLLGRGEVSALLFRPPRRASTPPSRPQPARAATGRLTFSTRPWTEVYLGDKKLGMTPLVRLELPAGTHRLRVVNPARKISRVVTVTIEAGQTTTLRKDLLH
ncbi:MAG: protein kinase [Deltaproteobacteria bacterium]|nr:MAG: protein kinase [Deltaproteobacteria bacterium]